MRSVKLVSTREAAKAIGLTERQLRRGWECGIYPALEIGGGSHLRWDIKLLNEAIIERIKKSTDAPQNKRQGIGTDTADCIEEPSDVSQWNDQEIIPYNTARIVSHYSREIIHKLLPLCTKEETNYSVYFVTDGEYVKIGRSTKGTSNRTRHLSTGNARYLRQIFTLFARDAQSMNTLENMLHKLFTSRRIRGEWFYLNGSEVYKEFVRLLCEAGFIRQEKVIT